MQFLFSAWENRSPVAVPCPQLHNAAGLSTAVGGVEIFWRCPETFGRWGHHKIGVEAGLTSQSGHGCWVGAGAPFAEKGGAPSRSQGIGGWGEVGVAPWHTQ